MTIKESAVWSLAMIALFAAMMLAGYPMRHGKMIWEDWHCGSVCQMEIGR